MLENNTATAVAESAKATGKFMDTLQNFFKPMLTKKQADADIYAIEKMVEAEKKYPHLDFSYQDGKINTRKLTNDELLERAKERKLIEYIKQEHNLETVIALTANEIKNNDTKVSDTSVDEDWLTRFFNIIENVSSDSMQIVWSKILAGEIIQPGKFSLRTLETIRNVSKDEAEIFQKIIPFVINSSNNLFITNDRDILEKNGINYEMILRLGECGLINSNSLLSFTLKVTNHDHVLISYNDRLIKILGKDNKPYNFSFGIYTLTKAGEELYSIISKTYNKKYISDLAEKIYTDNKDKITVSIHATAQPSGDRKILYIDPPLRSFS